MNDFSLLLKYNSFFNLEILKNDLKIYSIISHEMGPS